MSGRHIAVEGEVVTIKIVSPIDGSVYAELVPATDGTVETALARGRAAQAEWARVPVGERVGACLAFLEALVAMNDEIVPELAWQMGRPVRYGGERRGVEERVRYMAEIAEEALRPLVPGEAPGIRRWVTREPLGVVLTIAPWNYPYLTAVNSVFPALMAGNAVLLKHAAQTLLVGERFQTAFDRSGMPRGLFRNLVLSHGQTERLIASGAVDHVSFTGSVAGGRAMEQAAAGSFASLGLELGGKDAAYVREDANLEHAVENLVDGSFYNSGQSCCGVERIYVHERLYAPFVDGFVDLTKTYLVGNPLDEATTLGPMARPSLADTVREQIAEALRKGARQHIDIRVPQDHPGSPYLAPQVLTDVDHQMAVMREESFGPVVGIMNVRDDEEAVQLMNDSRYGLTASIWTTDLERAAELGARLDTGTVFANRCDYLDPALAWTGVKESGRGAALSRLGFAALTRPKSFHLREVM
jgi:acyl-CoA reductase-like NAD-dependent aldehyde dehydrogenase